MLELCKNEWQIYSDGKNDQQYQYITYPIQHLTDTDDRKILERKYRHIGKIPLFFNALRRGNSGTNFSSVLQLTYGEIVSHDNSLYSLIKMYH